MAIKKTEIDRLKNGGYYVLQNVSMFGDNSCQFADIYILVEQITDPKLADLIRAQNQKDQGPLPMKRAESVKSPESEESKFVSYELIKDSLTGFARMVYFKAKGGEPKPENNQLLAVEEG
jgi:hypothetical protein